MKTVGHVGGVITVSRRQPNPDGRAVQRAELGKSRGLWQWRCSVPTHAWESVGSGSGRSSSRPFRTAHTTISCLDLACSFLWMP